MEPRESVSRYRFYNPALFHKKKTWPTITNSSKCQNLDNNDPFSPAVALLPKACLCITVFIKRSLPTFSSRPQTQALSKNKVTFGQVHSWFTSVWSWPCALTAALPVWEPKREEDFFLASTIVQVSRVPLRLDARTGSTRTPHYTCSVTGAGLGGVSSWSGVCALLFLALRAACWEWRIAEAQSGLLDAWNAVGISLKVNTKKKSKMRNELYEGALRERWLFKYFAS